MSHQARSHGSDVKSGRATKFNFGKVEIGKEVTVFTSNGEWVFTRQPGSEVLSAYTVTNVFVKTQNLKYRPPKGPGGLATVDCFFKRGSSIGVTGQATGVVSQIIVDGAFVDLS
jgi:hypothetical protein